jgi:hypothetical protein
LGGVRLREIGEVVEVGASQRANEYLALGWVLLATFTHNDARHGRSMWYSLGWPRSQGEAVHPRTEALHLSVVDSTDMLYPPEDERVL